MELTAKAIEEYRAIYKELNGRDLSDEQALEQATRLLFAFQLVYRPIPKDEQEVYNKIKKSQE